MKGEKKKKMKRERGEWEAKKVISEDVDASFCLRKEMQSKIVEAGNVSKN